MRPRVFPAEDGETPWRLIDGFMASMRPRVFPAEDASAIARKSWTNIRGFNEAAGIPRGRLAW